VVLPEPSRLDHHVSAVDTDGGWAEVRNTVSGGGAGIVQAGVLHGGVHLHAVPSSSIQVLPRQLPATPRGFAGRSAELAALDRVLITAVPDDRDEGTPAPGCGGSQTGAAVMISTIGGAGGIGKTTLALTWAHRHLDLFPDGQLFVDLHGFSPAGEPVAPADALRGFLGALGVDLNGLPPDLEALSALYRGLVTERRMLVVLDNAASSEQVVPLLPGSPSCTVLVTSRITLAAVIDRYGARHLPLDVLTRGEARDLLVRRLGDQRVAVEPEVTDELAELCGRHPLALTITARHAGTRPRVPLAEFAAELRESGLEMLDDDDPAAGLPAVLSWSLHQLGEQQRTVFALLGIAPGPDTDLPAAAALTNLSQAQTRKALRTLEEHSLIDRLPHGRYSMHDLVRAYAATTAGDLPDSVRRTALERVVDHYRHGAHTAARVLDPYRPPLGLDPPAPGTHPHPLPDHPAAMAWLDTHHPHLLAAQHTAASAHRHHAVWHLAWTLTTFHWWRGHRHDDLTVWQLATAAAGQLPDPATRTLALRFLGLAQAALGQRDQAIEHLDRALFLAEHHEDTIEQSMTHQSLARVWRKWRDNEQALKHARQALALFRALNQPVWEAAALTTVGRLTAHLDDHDTARAHCQAALILNRHHHYADGEAFDLDSLGFIAHRTGHHHEAIRYYQQALTLHRTLGNTTEVAENLDDLAQPHLALGQHAQAHAAWHEALLLYRQSGRSTDAERVQRQLDDIDQTST
jgi:tetratricopeptide (TPR) repeat protein